MVHSYYTPTYYSSLHDSITSLCKTILPFSLKKRRLPASEKHLCDLQTNNLKWQQDSFHQMFNLMGLHKEGILAETEVATFRIYLVDTLIASPPHQEHPLILKDKLLFLQELLYAKCISEEEYHSSKRPLLQRLAVQGGVIDTRDIVLAGTKDYPKEKCREEEEEWSVIELKDENCLLTKETSVGSKTKSKYVCAMKHVKGVASAFTFMPSHETKADLDGRRNKMVLQDSSSSRSDNGKRKPFQKLFNREGEGKKQWRFEGLMKWKNNNSEEETAPLPLKERSDCDLVLDVVKREFKEHVGEMESARNEKQKPWIVFEDEDENENCHPNLFAPNPFEGCATTTKKGLNEESAFYDQQQHNPFWNSKHASGLHF